MFAKKQSTRLISLSLKKCDSRNYLLILPHLLIIAKSIHRRAYNSQFRQAIEPQLNTAKKGFRCHTPTSKAPILCLFRRFWPRRRRFLLYQNQQEHRNCLILRRLAYLCWHTYLLWCSATNRNFQIIPLYFQIFPRIIKLFLMRGFIWKS